MGQGSEGEVRGERCVLCRTCSGFGEEGGALILRLLVSKEWKSACGKHREEANA